MPRKQSYSSSSSEEYIKIPKKKLKNLSEDSELFKEKYMTKTEKKKPRNVKEVPEELKKQIKNIRSESMKDVQKKIKEIKDKFRK